MPFLNFWSGWFAVQYGDHMRFVIISGPIWGSFVVLGSFADLHVTKLWATQAWRKKSLVQHAKIVANIQQNRTLKSAVHDKLSFLCIYLLISFFIYFRNNELDNNIYILKSLLLCLWILKLCLANTCKLKMVMWFGILAYTVNS